MDLASTLTIVGMVVVFAALIVLAFSISILSKIININKNKNADTVNSADMATNTVNTGTVNAGTVKTQFHTSSQDDSELIAVITAAIMASMKQNPDFKIKIKSFRRIPDNSPEWNIAGKLASLNANIR